ncbi:uncharacterized protein LOC119740046 [Patiria miniata]|uniref:Uncharacterized protein n=1 Tax=Patiria miniata TaxID=46514 RepID=A0A914B5T2_PATMI|nr:uncharacterized protein LOC119740046 [Patiria miniata]
MDDGNGGKLDAQEPTKNDGSGTKTANGAVEAGSNSGTDVDSAVLSCLLAKTVNLRASLTSADRPRPATSIERGSNVGSYSHHFFGSKKHASYADHGYVRPHHSRADVNISKQAIDVDNNDDDHVPKGDLSTVESSKSDTELLSAPDEEELQDDSVTRLSGLLVKAVTLASANEMARQSKSSDPLFVPHTHLNKCNSSSKTYESGLADPGLGAEVKGHGSHEGITARRSAYGIEGERGAGITEGKRSSHGMLGRIKILTNCLSSSSDEGRSQEDVTPSSEDASPKRRLLSKIPKKKTKKKKKLLDAEKSGSGSEVGIGVSQATVDELASGIEVVKTTSDTKTKDAELPEFSPPDVVKEIKVNGKEASPSDLQFERLDDDAQHHDNLALSPHHSGSSIELLCDYSQHVEGGEQVLSAIVTPGRQKSPTGTKPTCADDTEAPSKESKEGEPGGRGTKQVHVAHHASAPVTLNQADGEDDKSHPEIALKAVKERYRVLSEQISDAIPGVSIDEKLRLAVLGSLSYAARSEDRPEPGRRVASAPGPLENMARHLAEEFAKSQHVESGISSFEGTYYDESSNHFHGTPNAKQESRSSSDSAKDVPVQAQDPTADLTCSSDSSQDDYVQQMRAAQRLIDSHHKSSPAPQQLQSIRDPGLKMIINDNDRSLRDIKRDYLGSGSPSTASSGYGSAFQAKIADLEANLSTSEGLGKPYKVTMPIEEDSVRKKEFGYILKMLEKEGGGQGLDSHRDPALLEAAVSYLYWSRHDAQDLLRKPQQHQKVVIEDKLEAQNLQLDLPPHSTVRNSETLEQLKAELEQKVKQIEDAISKSQEFEAAHATSGQVKQETAANSPEDKKSLLPAQELVIKDGAIHHPPVSKPVNLTLPDTEAKYSSASDSSTDDSRPPSSFHRSQQSMAFMSPGGALGSSVILSECGSAKRVRCEMEGRLAELEREKEEMAARMKEQRLTSVQLEAHLFDQLTTLTQEYQNLIAHDQEHKQLSKDLRLQLDRKQKELEQAKAHTFESSTDSQEFQNKLDILSFESKEKIHQLNIQLTFAQQENVRLQKKLRQEAVRQQGIQDDSKRRDEEARKEKEALMEELHQERNNRSQLDAELVSHAGDLHQMATTLQDLQTENRSQSQEIRRLHQALEQSIQDRAELQQELKQANHRLETKREQWKQQRRQLSDHLNETKASLDKSQLHLQTVSHTNRTLTATTAQLQDSYQALSSQLHKEKLAKETAGQEAQRIREELEAERKKRSDLVHSQLSQWQQSLQGSTKKLSEALEKKICRQQEELQHLMATNTELTADLPCNISKHSASTRADSDQFHDRNQLHHGQQAACRARMQDWTSFNTGGGLCPETCRGCSHCCQHHKRC